VKPAGTLRCESNRPNRRRVAAPTETATGFLELRLPAVPEQAAALALATFPLPAPRPGM